MRKVLLSSLVLAAVAATPAAAQTTGGLVTPFVGVVTGTPTDENRTVYGGSIGATSSVVGFEFDFGYAPNFYELEDDFGELGSSGSVSTLMGNVLVGLPLGRIRPYGTFGAGLMRSDLNVFDVFDDLDRSDFGINYGGGIIAFLTDNVGIRGDIRQFRSLQNDDLDDNFPEPTDFDLGDFTFWRVTAGVTFRF
jgi:opacity protein-like surface antigen